MKTQDPHQGMATPDIASKLPPCELERRLRILERAPMVAPLEFCYSARPTKGSKRALILDYDYTDKEMKILDRTLRNLNCRHVVDRHDGQSLYDFFRRGLSKNPTKVTTKEDSLAYFISNFVSHMNPANPTYQKVRGVLDSLSLETQIMEEMSKATKAFPEFINLQELAWFFTCLVPKDHPWLWRQLSVERTNELYEILYPVERDFVRNIGKNLGQTIPAIFRS